MTIIIFALVLSILVFAHELGHFLAAKKAGVYVEEFGFGYPPRAVTIGKKWGTIFSLNWIPFGGFVKILGENYDSENSFLGQKQFTDVSKKWQAAILAAGVAFNIIFAWLLFSLAFMIGVPAQINNDFGGEVRDPALTIVGVFSKSPASAAGLKTGDKIISIKSGGEIFQNLDPEKTANLINSSVGEVVLEIGRGDENLEFGLAPAANILDGKRIIGISMDMVGTLSLPPHEAIWQGIRTTADLSYLTVSALAGFVGDAIAGQADLSEITGPVGIVGLVGDASRLGLSYLITFTALISINLAIINLIPFPALDGGRLVFVGVEAVTKKPINPKVAGALNTMGFALLILLMVLVTYRDILKLI